MCDLRSLQIVASADGYYLEADLSKDIAVEDHATIKHERGLFHRVIHGAPVDVSELLPFSRNDDRFTVLRGRERCVSDSNLLFD